MTCLREAVTPPQDAETSREWAPKEGDKICEFYDHNKLQYIGQGSSGVVYSTTRIGSDEKVAIKRIRFSDPEFLHQSDGLREGESEIAMLEIVKGFLGVCQYIECVKDGANLDIVQEFVPGTDLQTKTSEGDLDEEICKDIASQMCTNLSKLHENQIVHRDLKLNNILLTDDHRVVIVDFGSARRSSIAMKTLCGTAEFMAPEAMRGSYDTTVDIWAVGAVIAAILCAACRLLLVTYVKAGSKDPEYLVSQISKSLDEEKISLEGRDFVKRLLQIEPDKRMSFKDALKHPWIATTTSEPNPTIGTSLEPPVSMGKVIERTQSLTLEATEVPNPLAVPRCLKRSFEGEDEDLDEAELTCRKKARSDSIRIDAKAAADDER
ncbi:kinase-like domain-containing protein [Mycena crocata]|nr:kinase-like domain-containing protein [Mycena crocata]